MIQVKQYSIAEIFDAMDASTRSRVVLPDGNTFKKNSHRLVLFKNKGTVCAACDLPATHFVLETHQEGVPPHLNLYGMRDGKAVLFTKDHVHPKSKGGANEQDNYVTMCSPCNFKKADKV